MAYDEIQSIFFSGEQIEFSFQQLLLALQHIQSNPSIKQSRIIPMLSTRTVFLVDAQQERGNAVAHRLLSHGYHPLLIATPLEAYTLYLQGIHLPFAIIVSREESSSHFFLNRLVQHSMQKYYWAMPIIPLTWQASTTPLLALPQISSASTTPTPPESSPVTTTPLTPLESSRRPPTTNPLAIQTVEQRETRPTAKISLAGQHLGRYQLIRPLGHNALSDVYYTYDRLREEHVALKSLQLRILPSKSLDYADSTTTIFQQEKELLARLHHPHILPLFTHGKSYVSGIPFLYKTMPYCSGGSLEDLLLQRPSHTLSLKETVAIVTQLASALEHAHEREIVYHNFKITNILLREHVKNIRTLHVFLTDFGPVAQALLPQQQQAGYPYLAPECWHKHYLPASDQYGLAALAYELLTGRPAFQGQAEAIMRHLHLTLTPQPPSQFNTSIPTALDHVILHALAKKPAERFGSLALFARAFQQACQER